MRDSRRGFCASVDLMAALSRRSDPGVNDNRGSFEFNSSWCCLSIRSCDRRSCSKLRTVVRFHQVYCPLSTSIVLDVVVCNWNIFEYVKPLSIKETDFSPGLKSAFSHRAPRTSSLHMILYICGGNRNMSAKVKYTAMYTGKVQGQLTVELLFTMQDASSA